MANIRLYQFPPKPTPVSADIIYLGDSAAAFAESKSTISQISTTIQPLLTLAQSQVTNLVSDLANRLINTNNLSDVSNARTALSNIGGQPRTVVGTGNPNGSQAGTAGISQYFDTVAQELWICIVTGTALTAVWENISTESNIEPANILYFSSAIGSDTTGNGSQAFPFSTYNFAASVAVTLASASNPYALFPMGVETVTGDITLFPFVNLCGLNSSVNQLVTTGNVVADATFSTTPNATFFAYTVGINAATSINLVLTAPETQIFLFNNCTFLTTPLINCSGSGANDTELFAFLNCLDIYQSPSFTVSDCVTVLDNTSAASITTTSTSTNIPSITALQNLGFFGPNVTVSTSVGAQGVIFVGWSTEIISLTLDGTNSIALLDSESYTSNLTFTNGATINSNIQILTISDGINANSSFTPVNYTPVTSPTYPTNSVTANLAGIDVALATLVSDTFPAITLTNTSNQITFGTGTTTILNVTTPASSLVYTLPDVGGNADLWLINPLGTQSLNGPFVMDDPTNFNISLGQTSMAASSTANYIVSIGWMANNAASAFTTQQCIGIGAFSGTFQQGDNNTFVGVGAGYGGLAGATGGGNIGFGGNALRSIYAGNNNVAVGFSSLGRLTSGTHNVSVGGTAGFNTITGNNNVFIGYGTSGGSNATNTVLVGYNISGSVDNEIVIGNSSSTQMRCDSVGTTAIGTTINPYSSLTLSSGASSPLTISPSTSASARTYTLPDAGSNGNFWIIDTTSIQTLNGPYVQSDQTNSNVSLGQGAMGPSSTAAGMTSIGIGANAACASTSATANVSVGVQAGTHVIGSNNTFIGTSCGAGATGATANRNAGVGSNVFRNITTGMRNAVVGQGSGGNITTGSQNCILGETAGTNLTTGSNNIIIGSMSEAGSTIGQVIVIGTGISTTIAGDIVIGNSSAAQMRSAGVGITAIGTTANPYGSLTVANGASSPFTISPRNAAANRTYYLSDVNVDGAIAINLLQEVDACSNLVTFDVLVSFSQLSSGGTAVLYASSMSKQYKIRDLKINSNGTNFAGGNRGISITDGTTVYSLISTISLSALTNQTWGSAILPFPASAALSTSTTAGSSIVAQYSGGTTDYTSGAILITGMIERIA